MENDLIETEKIKSGLKLASEEYLLSTNIIKNKKRKIFLRE